MGRRLVRALVAAGLVGGAGCAQLIGAGFDDARLGTGDDDAATGAPDVNPPDAVDAYIAPPPVDAGFDQLALGVDAPPPLDGAPLIDAASCDATVGSLTCASFAGVWETQDPKCKGGGTTSTCRHADPFTNDCTCPASSTGSGALNVLLDCSDGVFRAGVIQFCDVTGSVPSDWAGAYQVACTDSTCSVTTCQVPNPYSNSCTCPAGTSALTFDQVSAQQTTTQMVLCYTPGAPAITFAGAYQTNGNNCVVANPVTSACTCPPDAGIFGVRDLSNANNPTATPVWTCVPGH
jgi:hypothetical protein